ncbi:IS5 family transposase [Isosphaeraceae bacterium EP7]
MTDAPHFEGVRRVFIDATIVRTHRHGAGAPRKKTPGLRGVGASPGPRPQPGSLSSQIVAIAGDESTALAVVVVPGQSHDAPHLKPLLNQAVARLKPAEESEAQARPIDQQVGDKAFGGKPQREACAALGVEVVVPPKSNAVNPSPLDRAAYRERNRIERLFAKLKEFRRVATRYEKLKETFLGLIHLVLGFIRLRSINNVNRA